MPLVVPEVNAEVLDQRPPRGIVANPNCSTIQLVLALAPIHRSVGLEQVRVATYQAVSGAGRAASEALEDGLASALAGSLMALETSGPLTMARTLVNCMSADRSHSQTLSRAGRPSVDRNPLGNVTPESGSAEARVPSGTPGIFRELPTTK